MDKRRGNPYRAERFMKSNPIVTLLMVAVCGVGLVVLSLAIGAELQHRALRSLQPKLIEAQNSRNAVGMLVNDAVEYGKTHPAIDIILGPAGIKPNRSGAMPASKAANK
jgi:hypothetical protein